MNVKSIFLIVFAFIICFQSSCSLALNLPEAKVTIKVVDDAGGAIVGETVVVGFEVPMLTEQGIKNFIVKGSTDANGLFSTSHATIGHVGYQIEKAGFYKSSGAYEFHQRNGDRWEPWNPQITVKFRKTEKPIPMYARNSKMSGLEIPIIGKAIGFDLIEYAWMPPHGKGKHSDMLFRLDRRIVNDEDFEATLTITFPNKHDGIQLYKEDLKNGSVFKLPRYAPTSGYSKKLTRMRRGESGKPVESDFEEDNNYIFRVRSEEKDGKFFRAMYGKIQGDIRIDPRGTKTGAILFKYYLNPDHTRNLEYDPSRNLFQNLNSTERVGL